MLVFEIGQYELQLIEILLVIKTLAAIKKNTFAL